MGPSKNPSHDLEAQAEKALIFGRYSPLGTSDSFSLFQATVSLSLFVSLCNPTWPQSHRDPSVSTSRVLGLKVCAAAIGYTSFLSYSTIWTPKPPFLLKHNDVFL